MNRYRVNKTRKREINSFLKKVKESNTYKNMMSKYEHTQRVNNIAMGETPVKPGRYSYVNKPRKPCAGCSITRRKNRR
jgi:hypothetical protein